MLALWVLLSFAAHADPPASPFGLTASMALSNGVPLVTFRFDIPPDHVLYAERLEFQTEDGPILKPASIPDPVPHHDVVSGEEKKVYDHPFSVVLAIDSALPLNLVVKMQGCSNTACYFPEKHRFSVTAAGIVSESIPRVTVDDSTPSPNSAINTNGFKIVARETGYIPRKAFLAFLERARTRQAATPDALPKFNQLGPLVSLLLIVVGGLGLNLTPCVLPLIPINLAIIGAGARASSRRRGFALGGTYGAGMALVYGILGLIVVLTGSKFGALNSSAWFNVGIALVFVVMSLAMFDVINVDFSRFQGRGATSSSWQKVPYVLALTMGVMAALLAGACVAPVVISVLLLAAHLYGKGVVLGLLLPFLLGLGMALPWPFAGAGLSFLPNPGKWMKWVKYFFGALILLFAGYYGHLAINAFQNDQLLLAQAKPSSGSGARASESDTALANALDQARAERLPVFVDFGASWCKNCVAMDSTVFSSDEVKQQLKQFIAVRYDAEKPNDSPAKEVLNRFGVLGLPTYVVLMPEK
jgi:thiol:disulfide interchange protein DsbD